MSFWAAAAPFVSSLVSGGLSYMGARRAQNINVEQAALDRQFQREMRNTQWQAAVSDMEAAGLNPALAYSQGPNAAPGGSRAQVQDAVTPAVSSAMQMRRMMADLQNVKAQTQKVRQEGRGAKAAADMAEARLAAYGIEKVDIDGVSSLKFSGEYPWIAREVQAAIKRSEAQARREGLTGDVMTPLADLSGRMGEWLPILALLSQLSPGGAIRSGAKFLRRPKVPTRTPIKPKGPKRRIGFRSRGGSRR